MPLLERIDQNNEKYIDNLIDKYNCSSAIAEAGRENLYSLYCTGCNDYVGICTWIIADQICYPFILIEKNRRRVHYGIDTFVKIREIAQKEGCRECRAKLSDATAITFAKACGFQITDQENVYQLII